MKKTDFKEIVEFYEGNITETDDEISIEANNELREGKKVRCVLKLTKYGFDGYEQTYSIIGGFGCPMDCVDKELVERELERYKFKKKDFVQMSLF